MIPKEGESTDVSRDSITCDGPGCEERSPSKRCSRCHCNFYCSIACQKKEWAEHKPYCISMDEMKKRINGVRSISEEELEPEEPAINDDCPICLSTLLTMENKPFVLKGCRHGFCATCLVEWQKQSQKIKIAAMSREGPSCPICRSETEDVETRLIAEAMLIGSRASFAVTSPDRQRELREEAVKKIDEILSLSAPTIQAYFSKAEMLIDLGRGKEAIEVLDELMEEDSRRKNHPLLLLMDQQEDAEREGDYAEAERLREAAVHLFERGEMVPNRLGKICCLYDIPLLKCAAYESMGEWKLAEEIYKSTITADVDGSEMPTAIQSRMMFMGIARCFYALGEFEKAIHASDAGIMANRHFPGVHKYKALSLQSMGQLDEAISIMQQAVIYETPWDEVHKEEVRKEYEEMCTLKTEASP